MNIFATDVSPIESARALDDKRVNKMATETAQILSTICHRVGVQVQYAPTHENHPCVIWAGENMDNFVWTLQHGIALCEEWAYRRGKAHGAHGPLLMTARGGKLLPRLNMTLPPNCTQFKRIPNVFEAYQHALNWKWAHDIRQPQWTNRAPPYWAKFALSDLVQPDDAR